MNKEIANFFWHGNELGDLEKACIRSFVFCGWDVRLWSFTGMQFPGATACNASEVMSDEMLYTINHAFPKAGTRTKHQESFAAFADLFRVKAMKQNSGWWFDFDCYCLRQEHEFTKLKNGKSFVAGIAELSGAVCNCAMWATDEFLSDLISKMDQRINQNQDLHWGELGPTLLTQTIIDNGQEKDVLPIHSFFPIPYQRAGMFVNPSETIKAKSKMKESYILSIWKNFHDYPEMREGVVLPPEGSLLAELYASTYHNDEKQDIDTIMSSQEIYNNFVQMCDLYRRITGRNISFIREMHDNMYSLQTGTTMIDIKNKLLN